MERVSFIESVKLESSEIGGKIYFKDYEQFKPFAEFIGYMETTEPIRLYYSTAQQQPDYESLDEWYKLVLIKELSKEEIDVKTGTLVCNVKFRRTVKVEKGQPNTFGAITIWRGIYLILIYTRIITDG